MKLILISAPGIVNEEIKTLVKLFKSGLDHFHLRKPEYSLEQFVDYIEQIPENFHDKIVIHNHYDLVNRYNLRGIHGNQRSIRDIKSNRIIHRSCSLHSVSEIEQSARVFDYVFLSPIFGSISKPGYLGNFELNLLKEQIQNLKQSGLLGKTEIIALGGMDENNIETSEPIGFDGVAMLGAIWTPDINNHERVEKFIKIKNILHKNIELPHA